ncbi:MAG: calcium:proton antiporter [Planctomycetes bacterium]|jgi:Ca2+:H+ antiporter|nr:calcium:proton antiporter [Planctomycetota bacterium]MCP4839774.1 calcium:proton antiporter [Planctomycetota bacterium]
MIFSLMLVPVTWWLIPGWFNEPSASPVRSILLFAGLFAVILWSAFGVVRHADCLAILLGEPLGTIVLTLAVIGIEVTMIATLMLTGDGNADLGRDTMFSVLMLVLNGLVGITLIVGGLKHREPAFNLRGANAYLSVIIPLAILGLVLPRYTTSTTDASASPLISVFLVVMCVTLYGVFLSIQTLRHRHFFTQPEEDDLDVGDKPHVPPGIKTVPYHAVLLVLMMIPVVLLAKTLAVLMDAGVERLGAPQQLAGLVVAILVLTPEGVTAIQAAKANQMQRGVNLCLGSALATIGLTIPAVICVGWATGLTVQLGLSSLDQLLLFLTLLSSTVTFAGGRTNILQGAVHVVLFVAWLVLIFD